MLLERIKPLEYKEYCGWVYVGEIGENFLATEIDCEGRYYSAVHVLSKKVWKIKTEVV